MRLSPSRTRCKRFSVLLFLAQTLLFIEFGLFFVLQRIVDLFSGTDLNNIFNIVNKYLSVSNITGVKNFFSGFDHNLYRNFADNDSCLHFGKARLLQFQLPGRIQTFLFAVCIQGYGMPSCREYQAPSLRFLGFQNGFLYR